jgi:hypothetical protein
MVLCIPFYGFYFVFAVNKSNTLMFLFGTEILVELGPLLSRI